MKKIVIVAGDTSGDLYGGKLAKKIKETDSSCHLYSFGGRHLAQNSEQLVDLVSGSVCGLAEIITSLSRLRKLFCSILASIEKIKPHLIIFIDFPDFNLRLAKKINRKYPVFYYVSPQVWAWRKKRVKTIKKYVDKMIPIFKFETKIYQKEGVDTLYFGHPLLEIINQKNLERKKIISFLPGSRQNEIKKHLPILAQAKDLIKKSIPGYTFRIIKPKEVNKKMYSKFFDEEEISNHSYQELAKSEFIIAASGTATIETAILEIPHVIIYKVNKLTWYILKKIIKTKFAGMLNLLGEELIVPELIQAKATPGNIAEITLNYLQNEQAYNNFRQKLKEAKKILAPYKGISQFAAYIVQNLPELRPSRRK